MKQLPNLYALDKRGGIKICKIEYDYVGNKGKITRRTGKLDGKLTEKTTLVSKGKNIGKVNETTIEQQTSNEAGSLWRAKHNEGYKSYDQLSEKLAEQNFGKPVLAETSASVKSCIMYLGLKSNTNEYWDELPMLAARYTTLKNKITGSYFIQAKLNGVRCIAKYRNGNVYLLSRGGEYYHVPHLEEQLLRLFKEITKGKANYSDVIFDGEIYQHGIPLQVISGAVRKEHRDMFTTDDWLEYHIYDLVDDSSPQVQRLERLNHIANACFGKLRSIFMHDTEIIHDIQNNKGLIKTFHDEAIDKGYEGLILREYYGRYEMSFRSNSLIKVKEFIDQEFVIVGCKVTEGNSIEESFVFLLKNDTTSGTFYARPTGTAAMKRMWYNNRETWEGKKATIRYQERSTEGLPIQAHVRSEKTDCLVIENIRTNGE